MSVTTAAILVGLVFASIVAFRTRGDGFWAAMGALGAGGLALSLVRNGVVMSASVDLLDVLILGVGLVAAAEGFGLPRSLSARLGIGFRSREWDFDRKLADVLRPLNSMLDGHPHGTWDEASGDRDDEMVEDGRKRLEALARMKPPDEQWRALAWKYATIYGAHLDAIQSDPPAAVSPSIIQMMEAASTERERLRAAYRADADRLYQSSLAVRLLRKRRD